MSGHELKAFNNFTLQRVYMHTTSKFTIRGQQNISLCDV